jgi:hypothetical protein
MRERIDVLITLLYIALRNDNEVEINRLMALVSDPIERELKCSMAHCS